MEDVLCPYDRTLLSWPQRTVRWYNMNEHRKHYATWKKLDTKVTYYIILLKWFVSNQ